jgi:hypothetical protein
MVVHVCDPSTREVEAGWAYFLSQKKRKKKGSAKVTGWEVSFEHLQARPHAGIS